MGRVPIPVWCLLALAAVASSCSRRPAQNDADYATAVAAFHTGLAALETSQDVLARRELERVTALAPREPAGWANLGLLLLRQQQNDAAMKHLATAGSLAPDNAAIERLRALAASRQGDLPQAIAHWRRAGELDPSDSKAPFALAQELERMGGADNDAQAARTLTELASRGGNLAVLIELGRLSARRGDKAGLDLALDRMSAGANAWPADARERLESVRTAASAGPAAAATPMVFLKNTLLPTPAYRTALAEISTPRSDVGEPLRQLVTLPNPPPRPAAVDDRLTFSIDAAPAIALDRPTWAGIVSLAGDRPVVAAAGARDLRLASGAVLALPAGAAWAEGVTGAAAADLNYDFRTDIVVAGTGGLRFFRQSEDGAFTDVTSRTGVAAALLRDAILDVWSGDLDTDGDLDLVAARRNGPPLVLRNNGDDSFAVSTPFGALTGLRGFAWADVDGEGVPDAITIDQAGSIRLFLNTRGGRFREVPLPAGPAVAAVAAAEVTGDGILDAVGRTITGGLIRVSQRRDSGGWEVGELVRLDALRTVAPETSRLHVADLDNNAAADFVVSAAGASHVVLSGPDGRFTVLPGTIGSAVQAVGDLDGDGRVDLVGRGSGGVSIARSAGAKRYHWQTLRPRAATATGDQRINSFGIGGEVEIRTGLHTQKQVILSPLVHFGLGDATSAEVARITWPNGVLQSEFGLAADTTVAASQRLKGSCPWLFAWNGRELAFVTDFIWRSPLGLRINAQATADVLMTEDWVRIRGEQLAARNGVYDLRISAELWETHFFDLVSLMVVDHPEGTEIFVDERFAVPAPPLKLVATSPVRAFASARDDRGRPVDDAVAERDDRHLDFAGRGPYQGVTREHYVEIELPEDAPRSGPLWLVGQGWIHPTDSSVNVALGQGAHASPQGLSIAVAGADGRFRTKRTGLGFPAGKDKTVLLDLAGLFPRAGPRRLRLQTNLEIYWDRLGWAVGRPDVRVTPRVLPARSADLRYRGYSVTEQKDAATPERPVYRLAGTAPRWRDLEGFHTRFGDVRELLASVDDRYVIMNAGDEIVLTFPEAPSPPPGMVRDFVLVGDGWVKDGDYNTTASRTVLPLPTHRSARYADEAGRLVDDPVYRRHEADFARYHTRYVSPDEIRDALTPRSASPETRRPR